MPIEKYPAQPLVGEGEPKFYWVIPPNPAGWSEPVFSFWELTAETWSDHHIHSEWIYIIEGHLFAKVDGVEMEFHKGDIAFIPGGFTGYYKAPVYAKMLSIYGPSGATIATNRVFGKLT